MSNESWQKQTNKPLFPDILWSRPENKSQAGKLLIIGGNAHGFAVVSESYEAALKAGVGECKVIVPDALKNILGSQPFISEFTASSVSGGFARASLNSLRASSNWAHATWLAGDFGRSSETALLLENLLDSSSRLIFSGDSLDFFLPRSKVLLEREETLLLLSFEQFQRLNAGVSAKAVTSQMGLIALVDLLAQSSANFAAQLVVKYEDHLVIASRGEVVSTSNSSHDQEQWASAVVWWLQFPDKPLPAIASGLWAGTVQ